MWRDWTLTPWARGVLDAHPVAEWEIVDREPDEDPEPRSTRAGWHISDDPADDFADLPGYLPLFLFRELRDMDTSEVDAYNLGLATYQTADLARTALALAVGRVARRLAGLPDSGTNAGS